MCIRLCMWFAMSAVFAACPAVWAQWNWGPGSSIYNANGGPVRIGAVDEEGGNKLFVVGNVGIAASTSYTARQLILSYNYTSNYGQIYAYDVYGGYKNLYLNPSGGNVGIRTINATHPLTVAGQIKSTTGGFVLPDGTVIASWGDLGGGWTAGETSVYVTGKNVGIGTSTPGAALHVNGSVRGNQFGALRVDTGNGYVDIGPKNTGWAHFYTDRYAYYFNKEIRVASGYIGSYSENLSLRTGGITRMTLARVNGYVGIGTASPSERLHVAGRVKASAGFVLPDGTLIDSADDMGKWSSSASNIYFNTGNVGIGTASPSERLHVGGRVKASAGFVLPDGTLIDSADDMGKWSSSASNIYFNTGNVGIGTASPQSLLAVNGIITAKEVKVTQTGWADFVFADGYPLTPLDQLEAQIKTQRRLPGIPTAAEVEANGVNVGEMQTRLLQKVEELTLYMIGLKKEADALKSRVSELENR